MFVVLELVDIGYSSSKFKTFLFGLNIKLVDKGIEIEKINKEINSHIHNNWTKVRIEDSVLDYTGNPLVYLDEYITALECNKKFVLPEKHEIEHIMPRSGQNINQIRIDAGLDDKAEFLSVVNKLGNKLLLEENINRSIGNAWFKTKIQNSISEKRGYKDSQFCVAKKIVDSYVDNLDPIWTVDDIHSRTEKISKKVSNFVFSED